MLLLVILLLSVPSVQADASLEALMTRLQKKYDMLETIRADFTQTYRSKRFSETIEEQGVVYFRRGGQMRWEYVQPERKMFISDGETFYYYVEEDRQMLKAPARQSGDQRSPALFLAGRGSFLKDFKAEWADPRPASHLVKLTPVHEQTDFQYLIVQVDPVDGFIQRLLVVDAYDNRTEYTFRQIQENPKLPADFFSFQPPPGTDVIYQRGDSD